MSCCNAVAASCILALLINGKGLGQDGKLSAQVPANVELKTDIAYRDGNAKWRLDLAYPKERSDTPRAALVIVHGGGWRSGDKGSGLWRSLPLEYVAKGYVCISINYRLTDEAKFPACIEDCKCAVRWLRAHAQEYNVDPQRIGGYGNSAGAHLVAMLGLAGRDAGLEGDGPYREQSSMLQAVCCSATPSDFREWGKRSDGASSALSRLFDLDSPDLEKLLEQASPVAYARKDAPPFLVIHGTADTTVPVKHGVALVAALKAAGAESVEYIEIAGAGHGVFAQHASQTQPAMQAFFAAALQK